jgi:hypothetical protein
VSFDDLSYRLKVGLTTNRPKKPINGTWIPKMVPSIEPKIVIGCTGNMEK